MSDKNLTDDKVVSKSGATSSKCPPFDQISLDLLKLLAETPGANQIPIESLEALANRFWLGEQKHGRDNWRKGLGDADYMVERLNHAIYHAYKLINKLKGHIPWDDDDDCGAIMWAGAFAVVALANLRGKDTPEPMPINTESPNPIFHNFIHKEL